MIGPQDRTNPAERDRLAFAAVIFQLAADDPRYLRRLRRLSRSGAWRRAIHRRLRLSS